MQNDLFNGLLASFVDTHAQDTTWDYAHADFNNSHLAEYRHYTNNFVHGKFAMWNVQTGNLTIAAEFTEPYDLEKHRIPRY